MGRSPDQQLDSVKTRFSRIAKRLSEAEYSRQFLWREVQANRELIAEQKQKIESLIPTRDTRWEYLYWPLRRREVRAIVVAAPQDATERNRAAKLIRSGVGMRLTCHLYVRSFQSNNKWFLKIVKGPRWRSSMDQQTEESKNEKGSEETEPDDQ